MTDASRISDRDFAAVVRFAPLVSIDLVMRDRSGNVLLGLRTNAPAKGYFFVPGGVIRKNEPLRNAFLRILKAETGIERPPEKTQLIGVFEHIYPENRFGDPKYGTHYIVLAYELRFMRRPKIVADDQHERMRWMSVREVLLNDEVHPYTKAYIQPAARAGLALPRSPRGGRARLGAKGRKD